MTQILEPGVTQHVKESRQMWILNPKQQANKEDSVLYPQSGLFIFGGLDHRKKASNTLIVLRPAYEKNKKYISSKTGSFKKLVKPKLYFELE